MAHHTRWPLLLATLVMAGACRPAPPPGAGGQDPGSDLHDFVRCMRRHGVALADPVVTASKVEIGPQAGVPMATREEFDAATRACEAEGFSRFGSLGRSRPPDPDREDGALAFARCARSEGVDLPDPRFEDGEVTNWDPAALGLDLDDPATVATGRACAARSGFDPWRDL